MRKEKGEKRKVKMGRGAAGQEGAAAALVKSLLYLPSNTLKLSFSSIFFSILLILLTKLPLFLQLRHVLCARHNMF
jgi:hypothetical protein